MHDRRVDGKTLTFGNQGALFMNAMTWWDHDTESVWSQPWGSAIYGPLEGTALTLIPASIVPWPTWLDEHPDTTVLNNDLNPRRGSTSSIRDNFVIGVALEEFAAAYPYPLASDLRVINDRIGEHPVAVFVDPDTRDIKVFLRTPASVPVDAGDVSEVTFERNDAGEVIDHQTGSIWDVSRGAAIQGPLKGAVLQQIPYVTSFDWAWDDFFPHSTLYRGSGGGPPKSPPPRPQPDTRPN